ncbi:hypothetical protein NEMIN01_0349 [Nematocida minor]|uniref:uncharacterized protein n=1 Tax=Nematocida minor TaxID=1912983 RepID=UPI002220BD5D|nr:uncharacterized protein NEMIN01_0349 [Nematocida minor]KAI5189183.1 hypothetical protein NEMIN01_0349 [Nematocida minor]
MILKGTLKQVILVGAATLAYIQGARCEISDSDMVKIKDYWCDKELYFFREASIRIDFNKKLESLKTEALSFGLNLDEAIKKGNENISEILCQVANLSDITHGIDLKMRSRNFIVDKSLIASIKIEKEKLFLKALNNNTLAVKAINEYDSHMLGVVEAYYEKKNKNVNLKEMTLFKLAKKNKILAAKIVYHFFEIQKFDTDFFKEFKIEGEYENKESCGLMNSKLIYLNTTKKAILENNGDPLETANAHLHLLFYDKDHGVSPLMCSDIVHIYLNLLNENISEEEMRQKYMDITPGQIVKVILLEHLMADNIYDYKKNALFNTLPRVVQSALNLTDYNSTDAHESIKRMEKIQFKMLRGLSIIWNNRYTCREDTTSIIYYFCKDNDISYMNFKKLQDDFTSFKWFYQLDKSISTTEDLTFDLSYTHPVYYVYNRCENISYLTKKDTETNPVPLVETKDNEHFLRPYVIDAKDSDTVRAENINSCIKLSFANPVTVITKDNGSMEYKDVSAEFDRYMKLTVPTIHLDDVEVLKKRLDKLEIQAGESNPLQNS